MKKKWKYQFQDQRALCFTGFYSQKDLLKKRVTILCLSLFLKKEIRTYTSTLTYHVPCQITYSLRSTWVFLPYLISINLINTLVIVQSRKCLWTSNLHWYNLTAQGKSKCLINSKAAYDNQICVDIAFKIRADLAFWLLVVGWSLAILFCPIYSAFSKSMKIVDLRI